MALPWLADSVPLMLAPMQGLTNRAMRDVHAGLGRPDILFTEFLRVRQATSKRISRNDRRESAEQISSKTKCPPPPVVVQLVGHTASSLAEAAQMVQEHGARHINLNMGCPFGRTTSGRTGGAMLQTPELLPECVAAIRKVVRGSFSIKLRAGYDDPEQIFELLPMFANAGVDFLVLHPRTVVQKYCGGADHSITARVVAASTIPVIANGDVRTAEQGRRLLRESGAAGLMIGRGAIADPLLFQRIRGQAPDWVEAGQRRLEAAAYLTQVADAYAPLFCGDQQILGKLKAVVACMQDEQLEPWLKQLRRCRSLKRFLDSLEKYDNL